MRAVNVAPVLQDLRVMRESLAVALVVIDAVLLQPRPLREPDGRAVPYPQVPPGIHREFRLPGHPRHSPRLFRLLQQLPVVAPLVRRLEGAVILLLDQGLAHAAGPLRGDDLGAQYPRVFHRQLFREPVSTMTGEVEQVEAVVLPPRGIDKHRPSAVLSE